MPKLNGIDAFLEIYKIDNTIPVIALSAYAQDIDKQQALEYGFVDYVVKPVMPMTLLKIVQKYV